MAEKLKRGAKGNAVKSLQRTLDSLGFPTKADGDFGPATEKSVKAFQKARGFSPTGVIGEQENSLLFLSSASEVSLPLDFQSIADLLPQLYTQTYTLHGAQCPSNPEGMSLRNIGTESTSCCTMTAWLISKAFQQPFTKEEWRMWMVSNSPPSGVPPVPWYGPKVAVDWGIATTAPGEGVYLIQYFTQKGGHSLLIIDYDEETDRILTLESNSYAGLDGCGWAEIGNLRDVPNPGKDWKDKTSQTWEKRIESKVAVHAVRLFVDPASIQAWLAKG